MDSWYIIKVIEKIIIYTVIPKCHFQKKCYLRGIAVIVAKYLIN